MKNLKKGADVLLAVLVILYALTACNSKQNDADKAAGAQIMPGLTEDQPKQVDIPQKQLGKMGEPIGAMDVKNGNAVVCALFYTIGKATLFDNFEMAGIEPDEMVSFLTDESLTDGNGELKPSVKFLFIELTAQNVNANPERNITDLRILSAQTASYGGKDTKDSFFDVYPAEPVYFSNPTGKRVGDDWKEYYDYKLPVGQTKNLKAGWYVDTERYDVKNMYLTFGYEEYQKYIKIEI